MDQSIPLRSISKLVKSSLKSTFERVFPALTQNKFDIQLNSINNTIDYEYQCPSILKLFNQYKKQNIFSGFENAKDVANKIAQELDQQDQVIKKLTVSEQGFLNIQLNDTLIENEINSILRYGVNYPLEQKQKVVVDFSSPNIAKEMHVGHLRSTIIGESICRILEFQGHEVKRVNHVGDWGTQFGMLIAYLQQKYPDFKTNKPQLKEIEQLYRESKAIFDADEEFKKQSQLNVVKLQAYEESCFEAWQMICQLSREEFEKIYKRLGVRTEEYGESFYNKMIPAVLAECEEKGIVKLDKGAKCIYCPGFQIPLMVVKSDGGYNYDTTDMAAVRYRLIELKADRVIYITDLGQQTHFKMIFEAAKMMGWHQPPKTSLEHMGFGLVRGGDGKKFKTRSGDTVKLMDLLDEAQERALAQIKAKVQDQLEGKEFTTGSSLQPQEYDEASERIGMAAVKYFDLKQNRISDYNFNYDKMLDPKGNTAVYLFYSYVRICSVLRKAPLGNVIKNETFIVNKIQDVINKNSYKITNPYERLLASVLIKFIDVVDSVSEQLAINWLCDYIYEVCVRISENYIKYKILDEEHMITRVLLCEAAKRILQTAFSLVSIETIEKI